MSLIVLFLLVAAGLGLAFFRRKLSHTAFFAADHQANAWLAGLAGTAIGLSAFTFVGGPALVAEMGLGGLWMILPAPFTGVLQCWVLGAWLVQRHRRALSLPQLLGEEYGQKVQGVAAALVAVGCLAGVAVQAKGVSVLWETLVGGSGTLWALIFLLATLAYLAAGGMKAALWVDAGQGLVMGLVAVALGGFALYDAYTSGALAHLWAAKAVTLRFFGRVSPSQALSWYVLFTVGTLAQPHYLQKFFFLRSEKELAHLPLALTAPLMTTLTVWVGVGIAALAMVTSGQLPAGRDTVVPLLFQRLGGGIASAALVASLFAIMSTLASLLNLLVAAVTYDLPQALGKAPWSVNSARVLTVVFGLGAAGLGAVSHRSVVLLGLLGWGFFTAAFLPAVIAARFRLSSPLGLATAMVVGAISCLLLELFRHRLPPGWEPGLLGASVGFMTAMVIKGDGRWLGKHIS